MTCIIGRPGFVLAQWVIITGICISVCPCVAHHWHLYALGLHIADICIYSVCPWVAHHWHLINFLCPWVAHHWHLYAPGLHITDICIMCMPLVCTLLTSYVPGLHNHWHLYAPGLHITDICMPLDCTISDSDICMPLSCTVTDICICPWVAQSWTSWCPRVAQSSALANFVQALVDKNLYRTHEFSGNQY